MHYKEEILDTVVSLKTDSIISIRNLNVYIGSQPLLKNINLEIPRNKITVILGPSGCGKTTLLKSLNRLTDLQHNLKTTGEIFIDEEDILLSKDELTRKRQKMGLLSQRPFPLPMSVSYTHLTLPTKRIV